MAQVRREPLADQAAELLLQRIRAGEWSLGAKLPGETTLAPQLGVGRSTVREAIRQLAGRGVLASRQGAGVFVTALDVEEDWNAVLRRAEDHRMDELPEREVMRRWWDHMADIMEANADRSPVVVPLRRVFHLP